MMVANPIFPAKTLYGVTVDTGIAANFCMNANQNRKYGCVGSVDVVNQKRFFEQL